MIDSKQNTTTRLLSASAILNGSGYRSSVLNYLKDANRAVAPEIGLEIEPIARICAHMEHRQTRYWLLFLAVAAIALFTISIDPVLALLVVVLGSAVIYFHKTYNERYRYASNFQRETFDSDRVVGKFWAQLGPAYRSALPKTDQNLIVYKGFMPFVGAGTDLGGWSFSVATDKPKEILGRPAQPKLFSAAALYDSLDCSLNALGLDGLSSRDYFFVSGSDIRDDRSILPLVDSRPVQVFNTEIAAQYRLGSDSRIRQYKWIHVEDWGNELVLSFFLRCCLRGNSLFVELKRFLLTPISDQYRRVDQIRPLNWRSMAALLLTSVIVAPFYALFSPLALLLKINEGMESIFNTERRRRQKEISDNPIFNYGAETSIREKFSSNQFTHYYQKIDGDFYTKVIEREILDEIVCFLDDHNIDTSDIKEQQTTILNSGIIVHGGDVKADSLAVGAGARAIKRIAEKATRRRAITKAAAA
jgi:hypothetical protein